jgi:hypothetical protein
MKDYHPLSKEAKELLPDLVTQIKTGDWSWAEPLAEALDQQWAFAVARKDFPRIREIKKGLEIAIARAGSIPELRNRVERWRMMQEMGERLSQIHFHML